ncbi:MAG: DUF58 domain-containing protein [Lentisphaeria bacterium]|nr:DUF58 domain-containing protein [Lentisphaeria bacterium]
MSDREPLFPDELLAALRRGELPPQSASDARFFGRHRAAVPGDSPEFQDFRAYRPGDNLRRVDWNIYRRSGKLFLRRFRALPEKRHWLILDNSASMRCRPERLRTAWRIAALLGGALLDSGDPVTLRAGNFARNFPAGNAGAAEFITALERCFDAPPVAPRFDHPAGDGCCIISDFLHPEGLAAAEKLLSLVPGFTPIRIREPDEESPELAGEVRIVDAESRAGVVIRPDRELLRRYRDNLVRFKAMLKRSADRAGSRVREFDADLEVSALIRRVAEEFFVEGSR